MRITVTSTVYGPTYDSDGYYLAVGSSAPQRIGINADVTTTDLPPGDYSVLLSDIAPACRADSTLTVTVHSEETAPVEIGVTCGVPPCDFCLRRPAGSSNQHAPLTHDTKHKAHLGLTEVGVRAIYPRL